MNDIKVDISEFDGMLQPDEFVDWLQTVERVFEYKEVPEEQKVKIVAAKLKKHASIWWENLKRKHKCEGRSKVKTWNKMCQKLTRKYLHSHSYQYHFTQIQSSKRSSYQPIFSTKVLIDSRKPLTHQPTLSFKPEHNIIKERNTKIPKCFMCQGYGHIALDCVNRKVVSIFNGEIHEIFEEEKEYIYELFEEETMGEPIYDEEYVGADIRKVFNEEGRRNPIYEDEHAPDDIHEVFEKKEKDEPIYDREYLPAEYVKLWRLKEACKQQQLKTNFGQDTISSTLIAPRKISITKDVKTLHQTI